MLSFLAGQRQGLVCRSGGDGAGGAGVDAEPAA